MTKNEYLARLKSCLECIDASEREAAVQFYTEYFEDAGEENEEKVMAELGSPEKLARDMDADALVILTAVEKVSINFKKPDQKDLDRMSAAEAKQYIKEGHFAPGSMLPKIEAALNFVESKPGRIAIITSLDKAVDAIEGRAGTTITE